MKHVSRSCCWGADVSWMWMGTVEDRAFRAFSRVARRVRRSQSISNLCLLLTPNLTSNKEHESKMLHGFSRCLVVVFMFSLYYDYFYYLLKYLLFIINYLLLIIYYLLFIIYYSLFTIYYCLFVIIYYFSLVI